MLRKNSNISLLFDDLVGNNHEYGSQHLLYTVEGLLVAASDTRHQNTRNCRFRMAAPMVTRQGSFVMQEMHEKLQSTSQVGFEQNVVVEYGKSYFSLHLVQQRFEHKSYWHSSSNCVQKCPMCRRLRHHAKEDGQCRIIY